MSRVNDRVRNSIAWWVPAIGVLMFVGLAWTFVCWIGVTQPFDTTIRCIYDGHLQVGQKVRVTGYLSCNSEAGYRCFLSELPEDGRSLKLDLVCNKAIDSHLDRKVEIVGRVAKDSSGYSLVDTQ